MNKDSASFVDREIQDPTDGVERTIIAVMTVSKYPRNMKVSGMM